MGQNIHTKAIFPGSFDPFTIGHESIVRRGLTLFDEIVVAVGVNCDKKSYFSTEQRIAFIKKIFENEPRISVATYNGLTIDFAKQIGATHILRGLRSSTDFEFEAPIAHANRQMSGIDTTFILTLPEHAPICSSIVRDIHRNGGDISQFVPEEITNLIK